VAKRWGILIKPAAPRPCESEHRAIAEHGRADGGTVNRSDRSKEPPMNRVPVKRYQLMKRRFPALMSAVEKLGEAAAAAGPLDEKTKELVQLGAAAALRSEGAVHSHTRRALRSGASADEVRHAIVLLTSTIGFPTVAAALTWADDVIDKQRPKTLTV
jgi:AhpD family alkylhydroperoxidase